jgi:MYXO-CTERM domain-containing protein
MVSEGGLASAQRDEIEKTLADRGLDECDHELPLRADQPRLESLGGFGQRCNMAKQNGFTRQSMFHYVVTPGENARGIELAVQLEPEGSQELTWNVYVRRDEHVTFSTGFPPKVLDYDHALEGLSAKDASMVIDELSEVPFDSGASYHLVITHQNCSRSLATISTRSLELEPEGGAEGDDATLGDTAPSGDAVEAGGCGTAGANGGTPRPWAWLALAMMAGAAAAARRRRTA